MRKRAFDVSFTVVLDDEFNDIIMTVDDVKDAIRSEIRLMSGSYPFNLKVKPRWW